MPSAPNDALKELAAALGDDPAREIVRVFLREVSRSLAPLGAAPAEEQQRVVHGIKSSALLLGASRLSDWMRRAEERLRAGEGPLGPGDVAEAMAEFQAVEPGLRAYAGEGPLRT